MQGLHLCADLRGCAPQALMTEPAALRALCVQAVAEAGLQAVAECFHAFEPSGSGITGVVLLAESHLAIHTWPEQHDNPRFGEKVTLANLGWVRQHWSMTADNTRLTAPELNFSAFGKVDEGMDVVEKFVRVGDPSTGLDQGRLWADGAAYIESLPVKPTMITKATVAE